MMPGMRTTPASRCAWCGVRTDDVVSACAWEICGLPRLVVRRVLCAADGAGAAWWQRSGNGGWQTKQRREGLAGSPAVTRLACCSKKTIPGAVVGFSRRKRCCASSCNRSKPVSLHAGWEWDGGLIAIVTAHRCDVRHRAAPPRCAMLPSGRTARGYVVKGHVARTARAGGSPTSSDQRRNAPIEAPR